MQTNKMPGTCIKQAYHPSDLATRAWSSVASRSDELRLCSCVGAGLYLKEEKSPPHARGSIILTTHRILFVPAADFDPHDGIEVDLKDIRQTEHYAGFLSSSPKVSLLLAPPGTSARSITPAAAAAAAPRPDLSSSSRETAIVASGPTAQHDDKGEADSGAWVCAICTFSNHASSVCQLCGVPRQKASAPHSGSQTPIAVAERASTSASRLSEVVAPRIGDLTSGDALEYRLPKKQLQSDGAGRAITEPAELPAPAPKRRSSSNICPICTFANHPYLPTCELCGAPLSNSITKQGARRSGAVAPDADETSKAHDSTSAHLGGVESLKIAFREGKDKTFYAALKGALRARAWEAGPDSAPSLLPNSSLTPERRSSPFSSANATLRPGDATSSSSLAASSESARRPVGIDGILSAVDARTQANNQSLSVAFADLEALASQARKMVDLASSLSLKLAKAKANGDETVSQETQSLISNSLVKLGLNSPALVKTDTKDEKEFLLGLAKELAGLLYGAGAGAVGRTGSKISGEGLMGKGTVTGAGFIGSRSDAWSDTLSSQDSTSKGMMGLDEVWVIWNRARGVALISPATFRKVVDLLPLVTQPSIRMRVLLSGLRVLHTPRWSDESFQSRVMRHIYPSSSIAHGSASDLAWSSSSHLASADKNSKHGQVEAHPWGEGLSTVQLAHLECAPIAFISEMLQLAEMSGALVKDEDATSGTDRWYGNYILRTAALENGTGLPCSVDQIRIVD